MFFYVCVVSQVVGNFYPLNIYPFLLSPEFNNLKEALANILIIGNGWVVSPGESSNQLFSLEDVEQK